MEPPDYKNGTFPFKLYHLGGPGSNLLGFVVFLVASFLVSDYLSLIFLIMAFVGLLIGLINGIPQTTKLVKTDGTDLIALEKSEAARKSFWTLLKVTALQTQGMRIKDMPEAFFEPPVTSKESMVAMQRVLVSDYAMDHHDFNGSAAIIDQVLSNDNITGLVRTKLLGDRIYIALVQRDNELADKLFDADHVNLETLRKQLAILRTLYVYAKTMHKEGAEGLFEEFMEISKHHPYEGEVMSEKELIALATTWDNDHGDKDEYKGGNHERHLQSEINEAF